MSKYQEVMSRITVTGEMRLRILENLRGEMAQEASGQAAEAPGNRPLRLWKYRKAATWAACLLLLGVCAAVLPRALRAGQEQQEDLQAVPDIVEYASAEELAAATGLPIREIPALQTTAASVSYCAYGQELAEIQYRMPGAASETVSSGADGYAISYRLSLGTEDNSGDYNVYGEETEVELGSCTVRMKGDDGRVSNVTWTDGTYSYSIYLEEPLDAASAEELVRSAQGGE